MTATPCRHGPPGSRPIVGEVIGFALAGKDRSTGLCGSPATRCSTTAYAASRTGSRVGTAILHLGRVRFPITGPLTYTMSGEDAAELCDLMRPRTVDPCALRGLVPLPRRSTGDHRGPRATPAPRPRPGAVGHDRRAPGAHLRLGYAANGRPKAELILTADEREQLTRDARRATSAQALALRSKIVLACADGLDQQDGGRAAAVLERITVSQVAQAVPRTPPRRSARRAASRSAAHDQRRPGRGRDRGDPGVDAAERDALDPVEDGRSGLGCRRRRSGRSGRTSAQAPPGRSLQALHRPVVHRQALRRGRALPESARGGGRAVCGREVPGPGLAALPAGVPDDARHAGATYP